MKKSRFFFLILLASGMLFLLPAHLVKTSLSIKGGESFSAGETVTITWEIMINHDVPHRIYFSPATGEPWQLVDSVPEISGKKIMSYKWAVPQIATATARIRIFQSFVSKPGEQTDDYTLVSNVFTIAKAATSLSNPPHHAASSRFQQGIHPAGYFDISGRVIDKVVATRIKTGKMTARRIIYYQ